MKWEPLNNLNDIRITDRPVVVYGNSHPDHADFLLTYLDNNEKTKYVKYRDITPLECRAVLRILLSRYLCSPAGSLLINTTKSGKPYIKNNAPFFNVSHSEFAYIIAISALGRVGIDMEGLTGREDIFSLADYSFSEGEKKVFFDKKNNPMGFLTIWTLKEALLKATGTGLINDLAQLNVFEKLHQYALESTAFVCPNNETASLVFRRSPCFLAEPRFFHLEHTIESLVSDLDVC